MIYSIVKMCSIPAIACVFMAMALAVPSAADVNHALFVYGASSSNDASTAGGEAAQEAFDQLGDAEPRMVLVITVAGEGAPAQTQAVMNAVAEVFDTSITFGVTGPQLFHNESITDKVVVWVAAGPGGIYKASSHFSGPNPDNNTLMNCGREIGNALKDQEVPDELSKMYFLFGGCDNPRDAQVVNGLAETVGNDIPLAGMSAVQDQAEVCIGTTIMPVNTNVGVLLYGAFTPHFGYKTSGGSLDDLVRDSYTATTAAVSGLDQDEPDAVLVFDCAGRRNNWNNSGNGASYIQRSVDGIEETAGGEHIPMCGLYTYGEIGKVNDDTKAIGSGFSISVVAFDADTLETDIGMPRAGRQDIFTPVLVRQSGVTVRSPFEENGMVRILTLNGMSVLTAGISPRASFRLPSALLPPGSYIIRLSSGPTEISRPLTVCR